MISELLGFVVLGLSLSVPVGAITIEMVKRGLRGGFWPAWFVGLGGMSADVVLMLLIYFGIANFLTGPVAQIVIWLFGFVVLVYLGYDSIRAAFRKLDVGGAVSKPSESLLQAYTSGFLIAISNPLNIVFWIGIYGSVLTTTLQSASGSAVLLYSSAIFIGIAAWDAVVAGSVHFGRSFTGERFMQWFSVGAGLVLIAFGLSFGWQAAVGMLSL
ncbi:LysE family translocator [Planococcus salinus]|uniref:Lysine transporter LysE n=1 Tax=Planococcus salinus TaxID=1848460 RepID=A0A3M8P4W4_9BACL|nr:LysE family transporter [Planococcus salinus]RNF38728.1 lysine transporter LysE [Planococcus salinus]